MVPIIPNVKKFFPSFSPGTGIPSKSTGSYPLRMVISGLLTMAGYHHVSVALITGVFMLLGFVGFIMAIIAFFKKPENIWKPIVAVIVGLIGFVLGLILFILALITGLGITHSMYF